VKKTTDAFSPHKTPTAPVTPIASSANLRLLVNRGANATPESLIEEITRLKPQRNYEDFMDLGTCYVWTNSFPKAVDAYEMAARLAKAPQQLGGALYVKAGAMAFNNIRASLPIIDLAAKVRPDDIEIARLRLTLHQKAGDQLGQVVALDHLSQLDPSITGHEVDAGLTAVIIVSGVVAIYGIYSAHNLGIYALTPPEDRTKLVGPLMEGYNQVTGTALSTAVSPSGGIALAKGAITLSKMLTGDAK
jgi:hypothetical protein